MTRTEYNGMIAPFVARLTATPVKRPDNTWDLAFKLDGEPFEDWLLSDHFTGFGTLRAAAQAQVASSEIIKAEIQNEYFNFINGGDVSKLTMKMVTG